MESSERPSKRQRTAAIYERRRAVTACQPCRLRKTKCDNLRPTCSFCQKNHGHCVYPDSATDQSTYDPASLAILDRINHVVSLLETHPQLAPLAPASLDSSPTVLTSPADPQAAQAHGPGPGGGPPPDDVLGILNAPNLPAVNVNCESVLRWPVFSGTVPQVQSFVLNAEPAPDPDLSSRGASRPAIGRGIQEDEFQHLSKKFLKHAHVKNPILDITEFKGYVREAAENGPRWDGPSCLVLISCAIGCLTEPYDPFRDRGDISEGSPTAYSLSKADMATAQHYYLAAKKRLGLLGSSYLHVQCLFLFGMFEMYCLNAISAWEYFNQACLQHRNLLWRQSHAGASLDHDGSRKVRRLEQRLYWSCLKSETELRCEIPLPPSGVTGFHYPDLFPTPPTGASSPIPQSAEEVAKDGSNDEERSWFYYLAEISHRRMMNRAFALMSQGEMPEKDWVDHIEVYLEHVTSLNEDIDIWISHVPPAINTDVSDHELAHFVRLRSVLCREWIHRPFLYYAIHQPADDPHMSRVLPLAEACLRNCVDMTLRSPLHRHHGTWNTCRGAVLRALLLMASVRSGRVELPDRWREALNRALEMVRLWKTEAPDLEAASVALERILADTSRFTNLGAQIRE